VIDWPFEMHSLDGRSRVVLLPDRAWIPAIKFFSPVEAERSSIGCSEMSLERLRCGSEANRETLLRYDLDLGEWEANSVRLFVSKRVCL
jgi:hypothetical protein